MSGETVHGSEKGARPGAPTLALLAAPHILLLLRSLAEGPRQQTALRRESEYPAQSTLRAQLKRLSEIGAIEKHRDNRFPRVLEYELATRGGELLNVAETLERWLARSPNGPLELRRNPARAAVKALAVAWSSTMLRALAAAPLALTELDSVIGSISYPSLERRLTAMRLAGLVTARDYRGRSTPYALTPWARESATPLAAAVRWERRHQPASCPPFSALDVEAILLLVVPLLQPDSNLSGTMRIGTETQNGDRKLAGVTVTIDNGLVTSYTTRMRAHPDAWAIGSLGAWLNALIEAAPGELELGGDTVLSRSVVEQLSMLPAPDTPSQAAP